MFLHVQKLKHASKDPSHHSRSPEVVTTAINKIISYKHKMTF